VLYGNVTNVGVLGNVPKIIPGWVAPNSPDTGIHLPICSDISVSARRVVFPSYKPIKNSGVTCESTNCRGGFAGTLGIEGSGVAGGDGTTGTSAIGAEGCKAGKSTIGDGVVFTRGAAGVKTGAEMLALSRPFIHLSPSLRLIAEINPIIPTAGTLIQAVSTVVMPHWPPPDLPERRSLRDPPSIPLTWPGTRADQNTLRR
jgi:hypothetical protein